MDDATLQRVVSEVFQMPAGDVTDELSPDTLDDWDSLSHLRLVSALEEAFGVKFENAEIMDMTTVGAIREIVSRKKK
jgi:acyl carrier protein